MVTAIDIDCEEFFSEWQLAVIAFANMAKEIGFLISIAPFSHASEWQTIIKLLKADTISRINIQNYGCFGSCTDLLSLKDSFSNPIPVVLGQSTAGVNPIIHPPVYSNYKKIYDFYFNNKNKNIIGGFVWNYGSTGLNAPNPYNNCYTTVMRQGLNSIPLKLLPGCTIVE